MAKKRSKRSKRRPRSKSGFRSRADAELVDQLLHCFVALVKHGLELMLRAPSELAQKEFRKNPELVYTADQIPVLVLRSTASLRCGRRSGLTNCPGRCSASMS